MSHNEYAAYGPRLVLWYDRLLGPVLAPLREAVCATCRDFALGRVLDAGCGTGAQAALLHRAGCFCIGLDGSAAMRDRARRCLPPARVVAGDVTMLPFADQSFDVTLLSLVLHQLDPSERQRAFAEALRVGRTVLLVDYRLPERNMDYPAHGLSRLAERLAGRDHHARFLHYLGEGGLEGLLSKNLDPRQRTADSALDVLHRMPLLGGALSLVLCTKSRTARHENKGLPA